MRIMPLIRLTGLFIVASGCSANIPTLTPEDVARLQESGSSIVLLDVREEEEFMSESGHLEGALLIPVDSLAGMMQSVEEYRERMVICYCRSGRRSARATEILIQHGFNAYNMAGGINRWTDENRAKVFEDHQETP